MFLQDSATFYATLDETWQTGRFICDLRDMDAPREKERLCMCSQMAPF